MRQSERTDRSRDLLDECGRLPGRRPRGLLNESRIDAGQAYGRRFRPQLDRDDTGACDVEMKPAWPTSARRATNTLGDPALLNQLVDNRRDRAALEA